MANRADSDALFVKDGAPVKFCFHRSVRQGRAQITRDVERHGGQIVDREPLANVLLVDEQENLALFRRRYYSSTELYRLSLYVEQRGFVRACIRARSYHHSGPIKQGMPGRALGRGRGAGRARVPFTEEDRDHLAFYIATRCPTRDGRMGMNAYRDLERLGQTEDRSWEWARRHTTHSWREHYKMNPEMMDARIDYYLQRLKGVGHHFGYDPRRHDHRRRELQEEEEEGEEEEEEEGQRPGRHDRERREQVRPAVAAERQPDQAARDYLARHEQDHVALDEAESDGIQEEEVVILEPQRVKRHRVHLDAHHQPDVRETQAKRSRVSDASTIERRASGVEAGRDEGSSVREEGTDTEESDEIEGSDLFGDRIYGDESRFDFDAQEIDLPKPFSPRASPVPEQDGPPLSTQATLIASPLSVERQHTTALTLTPTKVVEDTLEPTGPPSSQQTLVMTQERITAQRARGASAQPGPSIPRERRAQGGVPAVDPPYRNTRARSRSVDPQPQLPPQRTDQGGRGKGKAKEVLVSIEEDIRVEEGPKEAYAEEDVGPASVTVQETFEDEMAVEGLLEASVDGEANGENRVGEGEYDEDDGSSDGDEDGEIISELSRFQMIEIEGEPSDSDDAETHASLVRSGAVPEGSAGGGDALEKSESDQDQHQHEDDEDSEEVDRASEILHAPSSPTPVRPRVTRSMTQTQQISPRRTRSGKQVRAALLPTAFPSPRTKARAVVDRVQEEERRIPYAPPLGTRAAKAVKGRRRR